MRFYHCSALWHYAYDVFLRSSASPACGHRGSVQSLPPPQSVMNCGLKVSERIPLLSEIVRTPARSARGQRPVTRPMSSRKNALFFLRSSHSARNHVLTLDQSALCAPIGDSHHTNIGNLRLASYHRHWDTALRTQRSALRLATKLNNVVGVFALRRVRDHASCPPIR